MELTRDALTKVKFRTRGQWYNAPQVDQFIEELMAAADRQAEELESLRQALSDREAQLEEARREAQVLGDQLKALQQEAAGKQEERDQLIADIKALRRFRESFRQAVEQDAKSLLQQARALPSQEALP